MNISELKRLIRLFENSKLSELEIEQEGGTRVRLKKGPRGGAEVAPDSEEGGPPSIPDSKEKISAAPVPGKEVPESSPNNKVIPAPIVGTFYRAPTPKSEPYVREGQMVHQGETLCVIEAMKVMNEIESEISGKVLKIYPENGDPVEYGEPLFLIEISQPPPQNP